LAGIRDIGHQLGIAARLAMRRVRRRGQSGDSGGFDPRGFRASLEPWVLGLGPEILAEHRFVDLPAREPPWYDTGVDLRAGDTLTWFAGGRVHLSRLLDIWVDPSFQLWARVGDTGPVFRGTRDTHTFTAIRDGRLWLASYFPGEWADESGRLGTPVADYARVSGGMSVLLLKWSGGGPAGQRLRNLAMAPSAPALMRAEAQRLDADSAAPPRWDYLWYLGGGEIYRSASREDGAPTICCRTHADVGILRHDAPLALEPGTRLRWSWRVDQLPVDLPEDTLPSHDYLSIAVEFDDGQDLTYYWSSSLPVGKVYRCPLPTWADKETHVVVRSGSDGLGRWLDEERDLFVDYRRIIGGPARRVVRVWLIANSLFQRGHGRCEYSGIELLGPRESIRVL